MAKTKTKNKTKTEVAVVDAAAVAAYLESSNIKRKSNVLPNLRINYNADYKNEILMDKDGKPFGQGTIITGTGDNMRVASEVLFIPINIQNQYQKLVQDKKSKRFKVVAQTIYHAPFSNDELIDDKGGICCGRPVGAAFKKLSKDEQKGWRKKVKFYCNILGLVFFEGEKEGIPCNLRVGGSTFVRVNKALNSVEDTPSLHEFKLFFTPKSAEEDTSNTAVNLTIEVGDLIQPTNQMIETAGDIKKYVEGLNENIRNNHFTNKVTSSVEEEGEVIDVVPEVVDGVDPDLDDDLPNWGG